MARGRRGGRGTKKPVKNNKYAICKSTLGSNAPKAKLEDCYRKVEQSLKKRKHKK